MVTRFARALLFVSSLYVLRTKAGREVPSARICFAWISLPQRNTTGNSLYWWWQVRLQFACVQNKLRVSFNLAETSADKLWCKLLLSSIYNKTGELVSNIYFSHYSVKFNLVLSKRNWATKKKKTKIHTHGLFLKVMSPDHFVFSFCLLVNVCSFVCLTVFSFS